MARAVDHRPVVELDHLTAQIRGVFVAVGHRDEAVFALGAVAPKNQQVGDADVGEVDELVLQLRAREAAAYYVRHRRDAVTSPQGRGDGHGARARAFGGALEHALRYLAIDDLGAVGGDVDVCRIERHEFIYGLEYLFDTLAPHGRQNFEGECRGVVGGKE